VKLNWLMVLGSLLLLSPLVACSSGDPYEAEMESAIASLEEKIPTRDRASVRICESMVSGPAMTSYTDALEFTSAAMQELTEADDPKGMFNALAFALIEFGDASAVADDAAYQTAAMNLANVCVDIVSGEYGK
jgi:hypothetical protein